MSYAILFRFNNRHSNTFFSKTVVIRRIQRSRTGYTLWLEYYSTIRIRFRFTIRPNTNSLFGALFGTETNTTRILGTALAIVSLLAVIDAAARRQCIQCCCFSVSHYHQPQRTYCSPVAIHNGAGNDYFFKKVVLVTFI